MDKEIEELNTISPKVALRLQKLAELESDWDGEGGESIPQNVISRAVCILRKVNNISPTLLKEVFIAPSPDGGLDLEWGTNEGGELLLFVPPLSKSVRFLLDRLTPSGVVLESEGILVSDKQLTDLVTKLLLKA